MSKIVKISCIALLMIHVSSCSTSVKQTEVKTGKGPQYRVDLDFHPRVKTKTFSENAPTLCFDEAHNNLAIKKGFYRPVLELIESDGYKISHNQTPFTKKSLGECNIVYISAVLPNEDYEKSRLLKNVSAFSDSEIKDIHHWVESGGSLLFMTDHKPMGSAAAKLLKKFGVFGSESNVRNPKFPVPPFNQDGIFAISRPLMNEKSAIIKGRDTTEALNKIFFFYGQALRGPENSDIFLKVGDDAIIGGLYNEEIIDRTQYPAAALALKVKKGRLVVFGDATVFTSKFDLWMNEPTGINRKGSDNVQMALNVAHWLSGVLNE